MLKFWGSCWQSQFLSACDGIGWEQIQETLTEIAVTGSCFTAIIVTAIWTSTVSSVKVFIISWQWNKSTSATQVRCTQHMRLRCRIYIRFVLNHRFWIAHPKKKHEPASRTPQQLTPNGRFIYTYHFTAWISAKNEREVHTMYVHWQCNTIVWKTQKKLSCEMYRAFIWCTCSTVGDRNTQKASLTPRLNTVSTSAGWEDFGFWKSECDSCFGDTPASFRLSRCFHNVYSNFVNERFPSPPRLVRLQIIVGSPN